MVQQRNAQGKGTQLVIDDKVISAKRLKKRMRRSHMNCPGQDPSSEQDVVIDASTSQPSTATEMDMPRKASRLSQTAKRCACTLDAKLPVLLSEAIYQSMSEIPPIPSLLTGSLTPSQGLPAPRRAGPLHKRLYQPLSRVPTGFSFKWPRPRLLLYSAHISSKMGFLSGQSKHPYT